MNKTLTSLLPAFLLIIASLALGGCASVIGAASNAPLEETPTTRSTGTIIDDELIETRALVNISKASPTLADAHLVVVSYNAVVLLAGQVASEADRAKAEETLRKLSKVRVVYNELAVMGPTSALVRTSDAWLTTKVKGNMIADDQLGAGKVKVVTENGVVYLLGLVTPEQSERAVAIARAVSGVQKVVKIFEYLR